MGSTSGTPIGPSVVTCPYCKVTFKTGKSEWADKSKTDKARYYLQVMRWWIGVAISFFGFFFGITLLIMSLAFHNALESHFTLILVVVGMEASVLAMAMVLYVARMAVKQSLERTRKAKLDNLAE